MTDLNDTFDNQIIMNVECPSCTRMTLKIGVTPKSCLIKCLSCDKAWFYRRVNERWA